MQSIRVRTSRRTQMVDVTQEVQRVVTALGVKAGETEIRRLDLQ